jgi:hypothetical protein
MGVPEQTPVAEVMECREISPKDECFADTEVSIVPVNKVVGPVYIQVRMCRTLEDIKSNKTPLSIWRDWNHIVVEAREQLNRDKGLEYLDGKGWKALNSDSVSLLPEDTTIFIRSCLQSSDANHVRCPGYIKVHPCVSDVELEKYKWSFDNQRCVPMTWFDLDHVKVRAEQILGSSCNLEYRYGHSWKPLLDIRVLSHEKRIAEFRAMGEIYVRVPSKYIRHD